MRFLPAACVAALTLAAGVAAPPRSAAAAGGDLSGVWILDRDAFRKQMEPLIARMLQAVPAPVLAKMRAQGKDPEETFRRSIGKGLDGTVEFLPDGKVRSTIGQEGEETRGTWSLDGDKLRVVAPDLGEVDGFVGEVAGDRILLRPQRKPTGPDAGPMADMVFPLMRQR